MVYIMQVGSKWRNGSVGKMCKYDKKKKTEKETFEINVKNMRLKIEEYWKRLTKRIEDRLNLMV